MQAYGRPLAMVPSFKYLERVLMEEYDDCPVVVGNLRNAQKSWERLKRILGWEGTNPYVSGIFSKAVVQAVLLLGSETWLLTTRMGQALGRFQHRVNRQITGS